jgi:hypothetical protein
VRAPLPDISAVVFQADQRSLGAEHERKGLRPDTDGAVSLDRLNILDSELQLVGASENALPRGIGKEGTNKGTPRRFVWLSNNFNYTSRVLSVATKVIVNQICFTPVFNTYFFGMQALLSGANLAETWERIRQTVPVSCLNSCKLWPAVTAFSFAFLPLEYRPVFGGVIAVGWQTYLSYLNRLAERNIARQLEGSLDPASGEKVAA